MVFIHRNNALFYCLSNYLKCRIKKLCFSPYRDLFLPCKGIGLIVYKKIKFLLIFNFLFSKIRDFQILKKQKVYKQLIYIVLMYVIFTPNKLLNFSKILEAEFFLVENSK